MESEVLSKDSKSNLYLYIGIGVFLLLVCIVLYLIFKKKEKQKEKNENKKELTKEEKEELIVNLQKVLNESFGKNSILKNSLKLRSDDKSNLSEEELKRLTDQDLNIFNRIIDTFNTDEQLKKYIQTLKNNNFLPSDCSNEKIYYLIRDVNNSCSQLISLAMKKYKESNNTDVNMFFYIYLLSTLSPKIYVVITDEMKYAEQTNLKLFKEYIKIQYNETQKVLNSYELNLVCLKKAKQDENNPVNKQYIENLYKQTISSPLVKDFFNFVIENSTLETDTEGYNYLKIDVSDPMKFKPTTLLSVYENINANCPPVDTITC